MKHTAAACLLFMICGSAMGHSGSTAYLQLVLDADETTLRADYALRDLDDSLGVDADNDGQLTWGELQAATPALVAYLAPRIKLVAGGEECPLRPAAELQVVEHSDGPYAAFRFNAACGAASHWQLRNTALFEFDASHRALLRWQQGHNSGAAVLRPEQPQAEMAARHNSLKTLASYWHEGLAHVWSGWDHMLFIAGLFLASALRREHGQWHAMERLGPTLADAAKLVTAFTIAHALTLCLTALGIMSLPSRLVESLVALSVLFAGVNNLWPLASRRQLSALAWVFGLIHGTAIAGALLDLGLPAAGRMVALLGFNLGVEVAQLLLVVVLVPLAFMLRKQRVYVPLLLVPGSLLVAAAGLLWFIDRAFDMAWALPI